MGLFGSILSVAAPIIGSVLGSNASKSAANTQADAANKANDTNWAIYQQNRTDSMPWLTAGTGAVNKLGIMLGTSGSASDRDYGSLLKTFDQTAFEADPGYQFRQTEATKALERSAAARGGLLSGAAAKAIQQRGQDIASDEYQNAYNRFNTNQTNIYNRLSGVAGTGQTAANTLGNAGQNASNASAGLMTSAANSNAAGQVGSTNAWTTGLTSAAGALGDALKRGTYYDPSTGITWNS